ncbi:uncharacterized protein MYCFIDRAFT_154272 [Pseudocercospora fijiensis CIRAD86]|uniref:Lipid droplet-associated hydrolase n=1 Tax=Pseudocercospora fijiensis (strain CIRAD86) TaxID=383855 RepID=M3AWT9_PSEFD|nr:uncharacterized protein MYCFIDRAFT_154272 [Pseudocercospora fijiensis CIRAD86]EME81583.1 hypothetical protein MYCFIDRAFT_154272 [Pseudocercospora fijiensis CIRAD86]
MVVTEFQDIIQFSTGNPESSRKILIYFVPGNPGLVEYYRRFLEHLRGLLREAKRKEHILIYAASHDGFEFQEETKRLHNHQNHAPPYSLAEEVQGLISKISTRAHQTAEEHPGSTLDVILVGHSVGSYMLLEAIEWYQQQTSEKAVYNIIGAICLFPTIVDMFRSDKGRVFKWILPIPGLGLALTGIIRLLQFFSPGLLTSLAKKHTPGPEGWEVTEALAKSDYGIRQVIYMARRELSEITHDKWHPATLWGVVDENDASHLNARTKLFFLWAHKDYWVHDDTRDEIIAKRRTRGTHETRHWPCMELLENEDIPHTFSLDPEHCRCVAMKTAEWIVEGLLEGVR